MMHGTYNVKLKPEDGNSTRLWNLVLTFKPPPNNLFVALKSDSSFENLPPVNVK